MARFLVLLIIANLLISSSSRFPAIGVAAAKCIKEYTVQQASETCRDIALRNDIPLAALQSWNAAGKCGGEGRNMRIGDVLCVKSAPRPIFVEYIDGFRTSMRAVPINSDVDFYFVLAWASDLPGRPWVFHSSITPAQVEDIKAQHSNVKVMLGVLATFVGASTPVTEWVSDTVRTFTSLVRQYHLDGIEIYPAATAANVTRFVAPMGEVVRQLKGNGVISVASAYSMPEDDPAFAELWRQGLIDFVNLRVNRGPTVAGGTAADYVTHFLSRASQLGDGVRLTAGMFTETACGEFLPFAYTPRTVLEASQLLLNMNATAGINIFSADNSGNFCFRFERDAQAMLAAGPAHNIADWNSAQLVI